MQPVSLLTSMRLASLVPRSRAPRNRSGSTVPDGFGSTRHTSWPRSSRCAAQSRTDGCSIAEMTNRSVVPASVPATARLFASVPPEVKVISSGRAPIRSATAARALSTASRARRPPSWRVEGFPGRSRRAAVIASRTAGSSGVVALWSRSMRLMFAFAVSVPGLERSPRDSDGTPRPRPHTPGEPLPRTGRGGGSPPRSTSYRLPIPRRAWSR